MLSTVVIFHLWPKRSNDIAIFSVVIQSAFAPGPVHISYQSSFHGHMRLSILGTAVCLHWCQGWLYVWLICLEYN
jgi:hypothetical protein